MSIYYKDIKDEKKNKLKENIKYLEDSSKNIIESVNKLKEIYEKINKSKEEIKLKILYFTFFNFIAIPC